MNMFEVYSEELTMAGLTLPGTLAWLLGIHTAGAQSHKLTVREAA